MSDDTSSSHHENSEPAPTPATAGEELQQQPIGRRAPGRRVALMISAVVILLLGGAAAGGVAWSNQRAAEERRVAAAERREAAERAEEQAEEQARQEAEEREAEEYAEAVEVHRTCTKQLRGLMDALQVVDARLDVGLTQSEMSSLVGKASIAYSRIDPKSLDGKCLSAGASLETAFNRYNTTVSDWNECIYDYACDVDADVLPGMQRAWAKASGTIAKAERLISQLDPDSPSYGKGAANSV
jgi:hypothetical protein